MMNNVQLSGRLTSDPKINDAVTCASFRLAVKRKWAKDGESDTDFINCKMLGERRAQFASKYLRKGVKIIVGGNIQTGSYQKQDGTTVYTTDVIVDDTEFCESKKNSPGEATPDANGFVQINFPDEGLPFN